LQRALGIRHLVHGEELLHLRERPRVAEPSQGADDRGGADKLSGLFLYVVPAFPQNLPDKRPRIAIAFFNVTVIRSLPVKVADCRLGVTAMS